MILPEDLESIRFLRDLPKPYLGEIARMATLKECQKGDVLFRQGEPTGVSYFILSGEVRLEIEDAIGEPIEVYTAGPGDLISWSPLLGRSLMSASGHATTRTRLAVLDVSRVLSMCQQDPRFATSFFRQVSCFLSDRLTSMYRCLAFARALQQMSPFAMSHEGND